MMNKSFYITLILLIYSLSLKADILLQQRGIDLKSALIAISRDIEVKLVDDIDARTEQQRITQTLSGNGIEILSQLSDIYDFDWYIYGGTLNVQSGEPYLNYSFRPRNMDTKSLLKEIKFTFKTNNRIKIKIVERGNAILFSGTRKFVSDAVSYSTMVDKNQFLKNKNNIELARIKFNYISVIDREINTFNDQEIIVPGASTLIALAIENIGTFENLTDKAILDQAYKVKLKDEDKQQLAGSEQTSKVQPLTATNSLLIRGTPSEVKLAKRIASLIDKKRNQILFTLKVYDVGTNVIQNIGIDSSWLDGSKGISEIVVPPFTNTSDFFKNFQSLSSTGLVRSIYQTNLLVLEGQKGIFGKSETANVALISDKQIKTEQIKADNSLYVTGRLLPSGEVQAKIEYIEQSLSDGYDSGSGDNSSDQYEQPRVTSQSLDSEVYIQPDQTVILGGFDNLVTETRTTGLPILSQIPLLGNLFKNTLKSKKKYKRYISISFKVVE